MATLLATLHVDAEGRVTGQVPRTVPPGDYVAPLEVPTTSAAVELELPVDDEPWDDRISLRREDLYDDAGR